MYAYQWVWVSADVCGCMSVSVWMCEYELWECLWVWESACECVCELVSVRVCMYECMCKFEWMQTYVDVWAWVCGCVSVSCECVCECVWVRPMDTQKTHTGSKHKHADRSVFYVGRPPFTVDMRPGTQKPGGLWTGRKLSASERPVNAEQPIRKMAEGSWEHIHNFNCWYTEQNKIFTYRFIFSHYFGAMS